MCRRCLGKLSSTRGGRPDICTTSLQLGAPPVPALPPWTRLPEVRSPSVEGAGGKPLFLVLGAVFCLFLPLLPSQRASAETCAALCPSAHPECEPLGNSATDSALQAFRLQWASSASRCPPPASVHLYPRGLFPAHWVTRDSLRPSSPANFSAIQEAAAKPSPVRRTLPGCPSQGTLSQL